MMSNQTVIVANTEPVPVSDAEHIAALQARIDVLEHLVQVKAQEIDAILADIRATADEIATLAARRHLAPLTRGFIDLSATLAASRPCPDDYGPGSDNETFTQGMD